MQCPACESKLNEADLDGLRVDLCLNGCGGVWFDRFELNQTSKIHAELIQSLFKASTSKHIDRIKTKKKTMPKRQNNHATAFLQHQKGG